MEYEEYWRRWLAIYIAEIIKENISRRVYDQGPFASNESYHFAIDAQADFTSCN